MLTLKRELFFSRTVLITQRYFGCLGPDFKYKTITSCSTRVDVSMLLSIAPDIAIGSNIVFDFVVSFESISVFGFVVRYLYVCVLRVRGTFTYYALQLRLCFTTLYTLT